MDVYAEQSVNGEIDVRKRALYALCWALICALVLAAVMTGAGIVSPSAQKLEIRWLNVLLTVLYVGAAILIFRQKDWLCVEYDYILRSGALEISGILNRKRRRGLARIPLEQIRLVAPACAAEAAAMLQAPKLKRHAWHIRPEGLWLIAYGQGSESHAAILELNDAMLASLRACRELERGVWRGLGGKNADNAGLS